MFYKWLRNKSNFWNVKVCTSLLYIGCSSFFFRKILQNNERKSVSNTNEYMSGISARNS